MKFISLINYKLILFFFLFQNSNTTKTKQYTQEFSSNNSTTKIDSNTYQINLNKTTSKISLILNELKNQYEEQKEKVAKDPENNNTKGSKALDQLIEKSTNEIKAKIAKETEKENKKEEKEIEIFQKEKSQKNKKTEANKSFKKFNARNKQSKTREKIKFAKRDILSNLRGNINFEEFKKISMAKNGNKNINKKDEKKLFEEFLKLKNPKKKKYMGDDNVFMFYNSLSLIMLSMLGGGVVGVIFILYFSFKSDNGTNSY